MKWSLMVGNFWGTELRLHVTMLLLVPYTLLAFRPEDFSGTLRLLLLIAALFACVALHELGHTLAARLYGIQVTSIVLWPLGGFANLSRRPEKTLPDIVISAAGPLTNFILFAGLALLTLLEWLFERSMLFPALSLWLREADVFSFLLSLAIANLSLALFNLVPIYPLDGGQITRNLLKLVFGEKWADRLLLLFSLPLALALTILGLVLRDVLMILTGLILVLTSVSLNIRALNGLTLGVLYFLDRGGYYLKRSDYDPAVREYTRAIQRSPNRAGLYVSRAVVYMNLLECQRAREDVDRALALDANSFIAWALRGELLSIEKNTPAALLSYNRSIELNPNWSFAYLDRGSLYQDMGDLPRALEDMNKGVDLGRGSPVGAVMRSILRHQMGDLDGAHADADLALRYAPYWMLVFSEIFMLNLEGRLDWALDYYGRAVERMPNAYQVYQGRADACRVNHRPGWAIEDYSRAIKLAPRQAGLYLSRGRALQQVDDLKRSVEDLQNAVRLADKSHVRRQAQELLNQLTAVRPASPAP